MQLPTLALLATAAISPVLADFYIVSIDEHLSDPSENGNSLDRTRLAACSSNNMDCSCVTGDAGSPLSGTNTDTSTDTETLPTEGQPIVTIEGTFCQTPGISLQLLPTQDWIIYANGSPDYRGTCIPADGEFDFCPGVGYYATGFRVLHCTNTDICT